MLAPYEFQNAVNMNFTNHITTCPLVPYKFQNTINMNFPFHCHIKICTHSIVLIIFILTREHKQNFLTCSQLYHFYGKWKTGIQDTIKSKHRTCIYTKISAKFDLSFRVQTSLSHWLGALNFKGKQKYRNSGQEQRELAYTVESPPDLNI